MKKYPIFFTFCYFTLFSFGRATDWAPDSLEGIFLKVTIDIPEHQMDVVGYQVPIPGSTLTVYSYIHNGTMYWGYDEKQMLKTMFFDYQKKSDQSFDLETWFPNTKTQYIKGSITMMDETRGYGPVVTVINLPGHPLNGEEIFPGTMSYEVLSSSPLLPPEITTGNYTIEATPTSWIIEQGTSDNDLYEYNNYNFKYFLPADKNWSVEWDDKAYSPNGLTSWRPTSLTLTSDQAGADVNFYFLEDKVTFDFFWEPTTTLGLTSTGENIVSTSSYDSSVDSGIRLNYFKNDRKLTAEIDENLSGNWVLFFEGSLDAGINSWAYHNLINGSQTSFVNTQFEALPGYPSLDVEGVLNQDIEATNSFTLSGPRPVSLAVAVGEDTLEDTISSNQADFTSAGTVLGGGWRSIDWFGYYYATTAGWLYHIDHEWIYPVVTSFDSVWFYSPTHEWLWTTQSAYPWTWFNTEQCWKYYVEKTGAWLTFNQDSGSFEQTENATELEEESNDVPSVVNATMEIYSDLFDYTEIVDLQTMFPNNSVRNFSISDMGYDSNKMKAQAQMQFFTTWADVEIEFTRPEGTAVLSTLTDNDSDEVPDFFDWPQSYSVSVVGDVHAQWNAFTYDSFFVSESIPAGTVTYGLGNSNLVRTSDSQKLVITRSISRTATTLGYFYADELPNGRIDTFTPQPVKASGTVELNLSAGNYSSEVTVSGDGVKTSTSLQGNGTASIQGDKLSLSDLPLPSMGNADLGKIHSFLADESMLESVTLTKRGEVYSGYVSKNQVHFWVEVSGL